MIKRESQKCRILRWGNITTSYNVGSAVKGATILTGYETGAIKPGSILAG